MLFYTEPSKPGVHSLWGSITSRKPWGEYFQPSSKGMAKMMRSMASPHFIYSSSDGDWPTLTYLYKAQNRNKTDDWTQITWKNSGRSLEDSTSFHFSLMCLSLFWDILMMGSHIGGHLPPNCHPPAICCLLKYKVLWEEPWLGRD